MTEQGNVFSDSRTKRILQTVERMESMPSMTPGTVPDDRRQDNPPPLVMALLEPLDVGQTARAYVLQKSEHPVQIVTIPDTVYGGTFKLHYGPIVAGTPDPTLSSGAIAYNATADQFKTALLIINAITRPDDINVGLGTIVIDEGGTKLVTRRWFVEFVGIENPSLLHPFNDALTDQATTGLPRREMTVQSHFLMPVDPPAEETVNGLAPFDTLNAQIPAGRIVSCEWYTDIGYAPPIGEPAVCAANCANAEVLLLAESTLGGSMEYYLSRFYGVWDQALARFTRDLVGGGSCDFAIASYNDFESHEYGDDEDDNSFINGWIVWHKFTDPLTTLRNDFAGTFAASAGGNFQSYMQQFAALKNAAEQWETTLEGGSEKDRIIIWMGLQPANQDEESATNCNGFSYPTALEVQTALKAAGITVYVLNPEGRTSGLDAAGNDCGSSVVGGAPARQATGIAEQTGGRVYYDAFDSDERMIESICDIFLDRRNRSTVVGDAL